MRILYLMAAFLLATSTAVAGVYKWVDENGKVHFSDTPMSANAQPLKLKSVNSVSFTQVNSSHGQQLTIYTAEWCGYCTKAKNFMRRENIAFREFDIEKSREGKMRYKQFNVKSIPLFTLNKERMAGFSEKRLLEMIKRNQK